MKRILNGYRRISFSTATRSAMTTATTACNKTNTSSDGNTSYATLEGPSYDSLIKDVEKFKGFVFDVDGTLVDTMPLLFTSFNDALSHPSIGLKPVPMERHASMSGHRPSFIVTQIMAEQKPGAPPASNDLCRAYHNLVVEYFEKNAHLATPIQSIIDVAKMAQSKNIPIAIATTGGRNNTYAKLDAVGLRSLFPDDVISSEEDIDTPGRGKPFPDVFLNAARRINVDPSQCAAFEDTPNGMLAAARAGMHVYDVRGAPGYPSASN